MPDINIPITITGTTEETLLPDGSVYITGAVSSFPRSIGERKRIKWGFSTTYAAGLDDTNWWVYVAMEKQGAIIPILTKVPIFHSLSVVGTFTAGTYLMAMDVPVGANPNLNNNCQVYLEVLTSTTWNIIVEFYQIYDETTYQNVAYQDNHNKLLMDMKTATSELSTSAAPNFYNANVGNLTINLLIEKPNQIHAPSTYLYTDYAAPVFGAQWPSRFYNQNESSATPYFENPVFELTRSAVAVTNLSASTNTDVLFKIDSATTPTKVLAWIIRTDKFDNNVTMFTNYEANLVEVETGGIGIGTDKIIGPVIDIALVSGTTYKCGFTLDATKLTNLGKYRLIAIVYDNANSQVNSFISDEYSVDESPCFNGDGFDAIASLDDYNRQFLGNNLECAIEERMRSKIKLYYPFNKWKNDIFNRLGLTVGNDIRRYLTNVIVTIYDTNYDPSFGIIQNVYDYKSSNKYGVNSYTAQDGLTMSFGNTWAEFVYEWRNRFESNLDCIGTLVNGVPVVPVQGTQYWGGKTLTVRWSLFFTYDDYNSPFTDEVIFFQQIRVKDYSDITVKHYSNGSGRTEFDSVVDFCQGEEPCFASVIGSLLADRKLIVNVTPKDGNINTLNEAETWAGNQLTQLTTASVTDEDEDYYTDGGNKNADFCIDTSKLSVNSYQISALAKKFVDTGFRVTEKGDPTVSEPRTTEETDKRITDNI
jgi:hypothetical protein